MPNVATIDSEIESLRSRMWQTRGARYYAAKRLRSKNTLSVFSISILSLYIIVFSIVCQIGMIDENHISKNLYFVTTTFASIFILLLSLLEASKNYLIRAENLHSCANSISILYEKINWLRAQSNQDIKSDKLLEIGREYSVEIKNQKENHSTIDFDMFRARNSKEFKINIIVSCSYIAKYYVDIIWLAMLLMAVPPGIIFFVA